MQYDHPHHGTLVISRHGESEWNVLGKWTGLTDVSLTEKGKGDATKLGQLLEDIEFDEIYTSNLKRTHETLDAILSGKGTGRTIPHTKHAALNERDYGIYTGKNKWEVQAEVDDVVFHGLRRGWDFPVEGGENLKDVYSRVAPYFDEEILPKLVAGKNILLVAHGNSIRALMKHLEDIGDEGIADVEMNFGEIVIYGFLDGAHKPAHKEVRKADVTTTHA